MNRYKITFTQTQLIIIVSIFLLLSGNYKFFADVLEVYPLNFENFGFLISLSLVLTSLSVFIFTLVSSKYTTKPTLILVLIISSLTSYFMNTYNVIIDSDMIRNMMQTNLEESLDLATFKQLIYFVFLGVLPAIVVYKTNLRYKKTKKEVIKKLKVISLTLAIVGLSLFTFSKHYTSFFREHKPFRFSINPTYWVYSSGKYINQTFIKKPTVLTKIGLDAKQNKLSDEKKIVIMVVGEALRAKSLSLNGYERETTPKIKQEDIINFSNLYSCATSTAISVPCMFSSYPRSEFNFNRGRYTQNVLDVLNHTNNISILWRDNNSNSKGVADRLQYENYRSSELNTICDGECRDKGMLVGLDKYIQEQGDKDILIVLHQMGNHGPAYYKRYPKEFEKYTPTCKTNQLEECTKEEITNAYDNTVLYTDDFLSKSINFLKKYNKTHQTALIYMSDHGESLGEKGVYLHGLPYMLAPDEQIHIASFMWFGDKVSPHIDLEKLKQRGAKKYSQDNLFHTLLGLFEVDTEVYNKNMDILQK